MENLENLNTRKIDLVTSDGKSFQLVFEPYAINNSISIEHISDTGELETINLLCLPVKKLEMFETMDMTKINKFYMLLENKFDFTHNYIEKIHDQIKELLQQI